MRRGLENKLHAFGDIAKRSTELKKKKEIDFDQAEWDEVEDEYAAAMDKATGGRELSLDAQQQVFFWQAVKQNIMDELRSDLRNVDKIKAPEGARRVEKQGDEYVVDGESVSLGAIMTDGSWGIDYSFDAGSVPKVVRKKYLVEEARRRLQDLLDQQIIADEMDRGYNAPTYDIIKQDKERRVEKPGLIAEKMVEIFLKKLTYDYGVDFDVETADVYQDVEQKLDFIIRRKSRARGVEVSAREGEEAERLGVQFTIDQTQAKRTAKLKQIDRTKNQFRRSGDHPVDDIVLVSVPLDGVKRIFDKWKRTQASGGPDELWDIKTKERIFRGVMEGVLTVEEIDQQWEMISS
ncbi:MAG: hypothetical protein HOJ15_01890 [Candidatus Jacksonbacteria bacterium]|mgnify:CR=1 FL=1|nr:hypothetical protein [Candidatus Jacksonbacteria bacterium]MBT6034169.1 hypothetical protein [Candidatus Jacksonbacteria bacterium]MBT6301158.1 hypothetical protein [Candidatus Jacksonbacteria bacterium]MBT6757258.1 hypothetical protein [Candidatus Jacksonbacteria bacterium]MBT6954766.1 hypothetical protein [Candidatus Jacksonbacteria bacterium]